MQMKARLEWDEFRPQAISLIHRSALDGWKDRSRWSKLRFEVVESFTLTRTDLPYALFNNIITTDLLSGDVHDAARAVRQLAGQFGVPFSWWIGPLTRPEDLAVQLHDGKIGNVEYERAMAVDLRRATATADRRIELRPVKNRTELALWCGLETSAFGFDAGLSAAWTDMQLACGSGPPSPWRHYLACVTGETVGTISCQHGEQVAHLGNLAILQKYRGRGLGEEIAAEAMSMARQDGYHVAVAITNRRSSSLSQRLGFQDVGRIGFLEIGVPDAAGSKDS